MPVKEIYGGATISFRLVLASRLMAVYFLEFRPALYGQRADWPLTAGRQQGTAEAAKPVSEGEQSSLYLTEEVDFISPVAKNRRIFI